MTSVTGVGDTPSATDTLSSNGLNDANIDDFLKLMIAELQNQDPLDPMENSEMLQQLNQIRSIGATDQLTDTLQSVLIGQNLSTASSMIGKEIGALTENGENITGIVDRISVEADGEDGTRAVRVHVGDHTIELENIRAVHSDEGNGEPSLTSE
jgi:flagellar basal-body rod modification protein FlgD